MNENDVYCYKLIMRIHQSKSTLFMRGQKNRETFEMLV